LSYTERPTGIPVEDGPNSTGELIDWNITLVFANNLVAYLLPKRYHSSAVGMNERKSEIFGGKDVQTTMFLVWNESFDSTWDHGSVTHSNISITYHE